MLCDGSYQLSRRPSLAFGVRATSFANVLNGRKLSIPISRAVVERLGHRKQQGAAVWRGLCQFLCQSLLTRSNSFEKLPPSIWEHKSNRRSPPLSVVSPAVTGAFAPSRAMSEFWSR
jgi:hypothetical protein